MFRIILSPEAGHALRRMPKNTAKRIAAKIDTVAVDPHAKNNQLTPLKGTDAKRLRVGAWRVILRIDDAAQTIRVRVIAPRGSAYR